MVVQTQEMSTGACAHPSICKYCLLESFLNSGYIGFQLSKLAAIICNDSRTTEQTFDELLNQVYNPRVRIPYSG